MQRCEYADVAMGKILILLILTFRILLCIYPLQHRVHINTHNGTQRLNGAVVQLCITNPNTSPNPMPNINLNRNYWAFGPL